MKVIRPFKGTYPITQTYAQHVARAKAGGYCSAPGPNCSRGYYYGGVDYGMPNKTPLLADQVAEIIELRKDSFGYGWHVRLLHADGYMSIYGHMNTVGFEVKVGDVVQPLDLIGYSDDTGLSTGPHLHWEIRKDGIPIDPAPMIVETVAELGVILPPPVSYTPIPAGNVFVIAAPFMNIRDAATRNSKDKGDLPYGLPLVITDQIIRNDDIIWREVKSKNGAPLWVAEKQGNTVYLEKA